MGSYRQILYQIVFGTKFRQPVLIEKNREQLFKYINGIIRNNNCKLYQINGVEDHLHILTDLHPSVCLADLVKDIKVASSILIRENRIFPSFIGWADGYGAFTYAYKDRDKIIRYIIQQKEHHKKFSFREEYIALLLEFGITFEQKYLP